MDNAEYDDAKQDQAFIEGRIQDLERMLATAMIIDEHPAVDFVGLGSHVLVEEEDGETRNIESSAPRRPTRATVASQTNRRWAGAARQESRRRGRGQRAGRQFPADR